MKQTIIKIKYDENIFWMATIGFSCITATPIAIWCNYFFGFGSLLGISISYVMLGLIGLVGVVIYRKKYE